MSILIKGMEMPTEAEISKCIIIRHDGEVWVVEFDPLVNECGYVACLPTNPMRAVPVVLGTFPPHGRLVDADALEKVMSEGIASSEKDGGFKHPFDIIRAIDAAPTIIPAEEGET